MTAEKKNSRPQPAGRVTDARGRTVSQLDPVAMHLLRRPGIIPADTLRNIADQVGLGMSRATRVTFWASVLGLVCLIVALAILVTRLNRGAIGARRFVLSLVPYGAVWIAPFSLWLHTRDTRHRRITGVMLDDRRCPHCGYDLRLLPVDPSDGATICPECGCAWKLDSAQEESDVRA